MIDSQVNWNEYNITARSSSSQLVNNNSYDLVLSMATTTTTIVANIVQVFQTQISIIFEF